MNRFRVDFVTDEQLRRIAEGYLNKQHPSGKLPIPIEEIIDLKEGIDIIPIEELSKYGHEAFPSRDRKTIYIDRGIYGHKNPNRLRFTLAHELSHIVLHSPVFDAADYIDIAGWKKFLAEIGDEMLKRLESQAHKMAGFLLVPTEDLSHQYSMMAERLEHDGIDIKKLPPEALKHIAKKIGEIFQVSSGVVHRRAVREGLWNWDDIPA